MLHLELRAWDIPVPTGACYIYFKTKRCNCYIQKLCICTCNKQLLNSKTAESTPLFVFMSRPVCYVPPGMTGGTLCFQVVCPSVLPSFRPSVHHVLGVPLCVQRPAKSMPFQQIIMHVLQCQHDLDVHLLFCVDLDLHITSSRGCV